MSPREEKEGTAKMHIDVYMEPERDENGKLKPGVVKHYDAARVASVSEAWVCIEHDIPKSAVNAEGAPLPPYGENAGWRVWLSAYEIVEIRRSTYCQEA